MSDIRTLYWKTVAIYPYIIYAGYKNIYAVPDDVLITGIHCTGKPLIAAPLKYDNLRKYGN